SRGSIATTSTLSHPPNHRPPASFQLSSTSDTHPSTPSNPPLPLTPTNRPPTLIPSSSSPYIHPYHLYPLTYLQPTFPPLPHSPPHSPPQSSAPYPPSSTPNTHPPTHPPSSPAISVAHRHFARIINKINIITSPFRARGDGAGGLLSWEWWRRGRGGIGRL
ncbi:hypothetical protein Pcinc_041386, partial [Petrolisthes cinctipes]